MLLRVIIGSSIRDDYNSLFFKSMSQGVLFGQPVKEKKGAGIKNNRTSRRSWFCNSVRCVRRTSECAQ